MKVLHGEGQRALFFRVLGVDVEANSMQLRMERFTLFWQQSDVELVRPCQQVMIWLHSAAHEQQPHQIDVYSNVEHIAHPRAYHCSQRARRWKSGRIRMCMAASTGSPWACQLMLPATLQIQRWARRRMCLVSPA